MDLISHPARLIVFSSVSLILGACARPTPPADTPPPRDQRSASKTPVARDEASTNEQPPQCLAEWHITDHASVLEEQRRTGPHRDDFQRTFEAVEVDLDTFKPVEATADLRIGERHVLWWPPERDAAVLDAQYAADFSGRDAFTLAAGESVELGQLRDAAEGLSPRRWLEVMVRGGILNPYAHLEATLCITKEAGDWSTGYEATVDATHTYYTNEENVDAYRFRLEITADHAVKVKGL